MITKGPWHRFGEWQINGPNTEPIAQIISFGTEDDARLIAAAPELLAALSFFVEQLEEDGHITPGGLVDETARTAIAKAIKPAESHSVANQ